MKIILAPIRGVTDCYFRETFAKYFNGVDYAMAPFIVTAKGEKIKETIFKDVLPDKCKNMKVIPQLLSKDSEEFLIYAKELKNYGYNEINLNLGCPHKVVARRGRGSGLLPFPEVIEKLLEEILSSIDIDLSIKLRLGRNEKSEILNLIDIFNKLKISNITIHPRTGIQMYEGDADFDYFKSFYKQFNKKIIYNGDITTKEKYEVLQNILPDIDEWMLGRGLLSNIYLAEDIKKINKENDILNFARFKEFHNELLALNEERLFGQKQILGKMKELWAYMIYMFPEQKKIYKKLLKTQTLHNYKLLFSDLVNDYLDS